MKKLCYFLGFALLTSSGISLADSLTYTMPAYAHTGGNYPGGMCFVPSFKTDNSCDPKGAKTSDCDYGISKMKKHLADKCAELEEVSITYNFSNDKLVSIDGYFGRFDLNGSDSRWIEDTKELTKKYAPDPFNPDHRVAHRVGNPLDNRLYVLQFWGDIPTKSKIKASKGYGFKIQEFVHHCNKVTGSGSYCNIAEYSIGK